LKNFVSHPVAEVLGDDQAFPLEQLGHLRLGKPNRFPARPRFNYRAPVVGLGTRRPALGIAFFAIFRGKFGLLLRRSFFIAHLSFVRLEHSAYSVSLFLLSMPQARL